MCYDRLVASFQFSNRRPKESEWLVADTDGWTIAHYFAQRQVMPVDFEHWAVADVEGITAAHAAASAGKLPKGFNQWMLRDGLGNTVAHYAVRSKHYDIHDFNQEIMKAVNKAGVSVWNQVQEHAKQKLEKLKEVLVD